MASYSLETDIGLLDYLEFHVQLEPEKYSCFLLFIAVDSAIERKRSKKKHQIIGNENLGTKSRKSVSPEYPIFSTSIQFQFFFKLVYLKSRCIQTPK